MRPIVVVSLVCIIFACSGVVKCHKVPVTVYYESLCPDSKKFINSQLYPTLLNENLSQWVNLTLVPYGISTKTKIDQDQWQFTCHHGPYECLGNKIHACALHEIETAAPKKPEQGFNPITLAFVNCLMDKAENITESGSEFRYEFHIPNCSEINHVPNYVAIENCQNHVLGTQYLAEYGDLTAALSPPLSSVPTIVFEDTFKKEDNELARTNFVKALCQYLHHDIPKECNAALATRFSHYLLTIVLLLTFKQLL